MTNEEKEKMLMEEIDKKYKVYFEKIKKIKFKNESYKYDEKFHKELSQYIKKKN